VTPNNLTQFVQAAWRAGQNVDLSDIGYGRVHWGNLTDVITSPYNYYYTLAGFAALTKSRTALEIGTHWGGSALALFRGMRTHVTSPELITVDITHESDNFLALSDEGKAIRKLVGNANTLPIISAIVGSMPRADLIFIDAEHAALPTLQSFCTYSALLRPKLVLLDDILLNDEMRSFWSILRQSYPEHTVNCTEIEVNTRQNPECGFGLWVNPDLNLAAMAV
jgi:predicted O-methyltransferase YrrM